MANLISEQVYLDLKKDLGTACILDEEKLFPEPKLSERYSVSIGTIRKAVGRLVEEGILERQQGRGTFLASAALSSSKTAASKLLSPEVSHLQRFKYGNAYSLHCQDDINKKLWGPHQKQIEPVNVPQSRKMVELAEWSEKCDIIFYSPLQLNENNQRYLQPVPDWLQKRVKQDFSASACDEFSSLMTGELLAIPLISNPAICYIDKRTLKKAGIPMPSQDWTWDDFLDICRALKKSGQMPLTLCPAPGCLYEPLLLQAGGNYFDTSGNVCLEEKSLGEVIGFLRTLIREKLCVNVYNLPQSFPRFISSGGSCITFCGPLIAGNLPVEQQQHWAFHHFPRNKFVGSATTFFGIGVSANSKRQEESWKFIEDVLYGGGFERCASLNGVYPAKSSLQADWQAGDIENSAVLQETLQYSQPLHSKKGFCKLFPAVYEIFDQMIEEKLSVSDGTKKLIGILAQNKNKNENYHFFN